MESGWIVTVTAPDGSERTILIPADQVRLFKGEAAGQSFTTALWLAYADMWTQGK
jgi:hypothetical protein